jgi:hypothetical protein
MGKTLVLVLAVVLAGATGARATIQQNALDTGNPDGEFSDNVTASVTGPGAASVNRGT